MNSGVWIFFFNLNNSRGVFIKWIRYVKEVYKTIELFGPKRHFSVNVVALKVSIFNDYEDSMKTIFRNKAL